MSDVKTKDERYRNWACVVYPDSAPDNWLDTLRDAKTPVLVSPLHDNDKNPTGEDKKPHWHVLTPFEGKKSREQIEEFYKSFGGVGCEVVKSLRGYARYLCHLDNPEKAQYSPDDVIALGGLDYLDIIGLPIDRYKAIGEMMDFCQSRGIVSFSVLCDYARENRFDWFRLLCDNSSYIVKEYLQSSHWTNTRCSLVDVDEETGEIL